MSTPTTENTSQDLNDWSSANSGGAQAPAFEGDPAPANDDVEQNPNVLPEDIYVPTSLEPGFTPEAGDVDPGSTRSAEEQGADGDLSDPEKRKAFDWNG